MKKVFWPINGYYVTFSLMLATIMFTIFSTRMHIPLPPYCIFIVAVAVAFFFSQRIVIDDKNVTGPSAYGKRRGRTSIPLNEAEAFFEKRKGWGSYLVIRHKTSSRQVYAPLRFYTGGAINQLMTILPNKSTNETALKEPLPE